MKTPFILTLTGLLFFPTAVVSLPLRENTPLVSQLSTDILEKNARAITVRVLVKNGQASGFIVAKAGNTYTVVTNAHVVSRGAPYRIITPDGNSYQATLQAQGDSFKRDDLAVLTFQSGVSYPVARVSQRWGDNEAVYGVGFDNETGNLRIISGKIAVIPPKPLSGGYQIGFTGNIEAGMSGGVLLNGEGEVIGVLGMSPGAVLESAYHYNDGTVPDGDTIASMQKVSFAVPVQKIGQFSTQLAQLFPQSEERVISQANYTGFIKEVDEIAAKITVRIEDPDGSNGSGVIIGKEGNTYYVATACHVVSSSFQCERENLLEKVTLITPDQQSYIIPKNQVIIPNTSFDLVILTFTSDKSYQVAELGNYQTQDEQWLFLSGFPGKDAKKQRQLTAGVVQDKDRNAFATKDQFSLANGNELVYTNSSSGGMSGGPVLDREGRVVGIHTGAENEVFSKPTGGYQEVSLGYSLGIPITTLLGLVQKTKINPKVFKDTRTVAQKISDTEAQQIKAQLFRFEKPTQEANGLDWLNYGNELWRSLQYQEAVKAFDKAIELLEKEENKETLAKAYYAKGLAFVDAGEYEQALVTFKQATDKDPGFSKAWYYQGAILRVLQQYELALTAYQKAIDKNDKTDFTVYVGQGGVLYELKRYPEAIESYNQVIKLKDNYPWAYNNRGILYTNQQKWDLALADYNKAIDINPNFALAYNNRGFLYYNQQKWDLALADYNKAIELNPNDAEAYNNRGLLYINQQKWDLALADYNKAIDINPNFALAYNNRGFLYYNQQKWELALADYNKAIEINPNLDMAYNNRGVLYTNQQKWDLALADYTKAIELNPNYDDAYYNRGNLYKDQQKWDLALADYTKAIELNPNDAEAYNNRSFLYYNQQKWDLALADLNKAIELNPKYANAYYNRGNLYYDQKKWDLALADYNKAIDINLKYAEAYYNRGLLYHNQQKWDLALADYNKAIDINPNDARAYNNRGNLYKDQQKWDLALADYNKAIEINPNYALAYGNRGLTYINKGDKQKGIADLQKAAQLFQAQGNIAAYQQVMQILQQLGG